MKKLLFKTLFSFLFIGSVSAASIDDFVITIKTDNTGTSSDTQFTIPTYGGSYDYNVDCDNDGVDDATNQTGSYTCNYAVAGTYTIRIKHNNLITHRGFPRIYFNNTGDKDKILSVNQWGTTKFTSMYRAFYGCSNLNSAVPQGSDTVGLSAWATDIPNLSSVTTISHIFRDATIFNQDISNWDTSNITSMYTAFYNATSFNQDLGAWNVSKVTNMGYLFSNTPFNQDISNWNTSKVTSFYRMFYNNHDFNQNIGNWNTANVTNMFSMFREASVFNQDIGAWDISKV